MNNFGSLFDLQGLSLDRLRNFLLVVDAGSLAKAAPGDANRQSLFSRQIKELEGFFGVGLTKRVGRQIQITEEGHHLARLVRQHFRELLEFREAMAGRSTTLRIGSQGSVIEWLVMPRLSALRASLGNVLLEMEQMRSRDTVRAVADGRLDMGIVREDALPPEMKRWKLRQVGYAIFAKSQLWKGCKTPEDLAGVAPIAELLHGGQFATRWQEWLKQRKLRPQVVARAASFSDLAQLVRSGTAAAVLPDFAVADFPDQDVKSQGIKRLKDRSLSLIVNTRSLDRAGVGEGAADCVCKVLSE